MQKILLCTSILILLAAPAGRTAEPAETAPPPQRELPTRLRGDSVGIRNVTPELIEELASLHVNVLRVHIDVDTSDPKISAELKKQMIKPEAVTADDPLVPYQSMLKQLDSILPLCHLHNISLILAGGRLVGHKGDVFYEMDANSRGEHLVAFWSAMSRRYKGEPAIVGYDIKNEPNYPDLQEARKIWWDDLLPKSIDAIRKEDKTIWLVVEAPPKGGLPWGFAQMPVLADPRVIYSFHHYMPHAYTHQGVRSIQARGEDTKGKYTYPGSSPSFDGGKELPWDKKAVEETMKEVILFEKRCPGARILVGEFGVIRWAPNGEKWLEDSIEIFERHGWDWTLHSLGGWNGWDPTYSSGAEMKNRPSLAGGEDTARFQVLKAAWAKNLEQPSAVSEKDEKRK